MSIQKKVLKCNHRPTWPFCHFVYIKNYSASYIFTKLIKCRSVRELTGFGALGRLRRPSTSSMLQVQGEAQGVELTDDV